MNNKGNWKFCSAELTESTDELNNPARGWYGIYTFSAQEQIDPKELRWCLREGESLALVLLDICVYRSKALDERALQNIRDILSFFMENKKDVILRPVYDREGNGKLCEPDTFEVVLKHLEQIGEVLKNMKHSVIIFQGMLVGSWGEMHDSRYLSAEHICRMWECIRQYTGNYIYVGVRTPAQWRTLVKKEAFSEKEYRYLTLFDDGILGSMTHLGTFGTMTKEAAGWNGAWTRKEELEFVSRLTEDVPCGGEVTLCAEEGNSEVNKAEFIVSELKKMHLTYLNSTYNMNVLNQWKKMKYTDSGIWGNSSLYEYIGSHLGYRFVVKKADMRCRWRGKAEFTIEIENCGFGRIFQETELLLIIDNGEVRKEVPVSVDMRKIYPGSKWLGTAVTELSEGKVFLRLQRKTDRRNICFANDSGADSLYIGCLHRG